MLSLVSRFTAATVVLAAVLLLAAAPAKAWHSTDMTGALPPLDFTLTRATDGKTVTAADYKGKITLLYFGYTFCPDVCPATLMNIADMLKVVGQGCRRCPRAVRDRRSQPRHAGGAEGVYRRLRAAGRRPARHAPINWRAVAKRYRVAYSVTPASKGKDYEVTHGSAVYAFNRDGRHQAAVHRADDAATASSTAPPTI